MLWGGRRGHGTIVASETVTVECRMPKFNDLSRCLVALEQNSTLIAAIELSRSSWLVGGVVPGLPRGLRKKLPPDADGLLRVLHRWRDEAIATGRCLRSRRKTPSLRCANASSWWRSRPGW
jgi:hypothetical protein